MSTGGERGRAETILERLRAELGAVDVDVSSRTAFQVLVGTLLSQHTNDLNAGRVYRRLEERFPVDPAALSKADLREVREAIHIAGLYRNKSRLLKELATIVSERFGGSLDPVLQLPFEEARERLMALPGVGPKTADILLLFCKGKPTFPVDTHIARVSKRLGLARRGSGYEETRSALQEVYKPPDYLGAHLLLIKLGRTYCRALKPNCRGCPVASECPKL